MTVSMSGESGGTVTARTYVKMILEGGPLDGEEQLVLNVPTTPGSTLVFNMPNYQTFDPASDGNTVIGLGLQVTYLFQQQGPPPGAADTWATSWIFEFVAEAFVPPPPFLPPTPIPPVQPVFVTLEGDSVLTILDSGISVTPGVQMVAEADLDVDGEVTPVQAVSVTMGATTVLSATQDSSSSFVLMTGVAQMIVTPS